MESKISFPPPLACKAVDSYVYFVLNLLLSWFMVIANVIYWENEESSHTYYVALRRWTLFVYVIRYFCRVLAQLNKHISVRLCACAAALPFLHMSALHHRMPLLLR